MSDDPIRDYLDGLRRELGRLGSLRRRRVLAEAEDHLREAAAELEAKGVEPGAAARSAVDAFGGPADLAGATEAPRIRLGVVLAITLAALAGLFGFRHSHPAPTRAGQRAATRTSAAALIRSIETGLSAHGILIVRFGHPPDLRGLPKRGPWMYVRLTSTRGASSVKPEWEAHMLAAAYAVSAPRHGLPAETGMYVYGPGQSTADGHGGPIHTLAIGVTTTASWIRPVAGGLTPEWVIPPVAGPTSIASASFKPTRAGATQLRDLLRASVRSVGLQLKSVTFDRVEGHLAPIVVATARYPGIIVRHDPLLDKALGWGPNSYEGIYFRLDYPDGRAAMITSFASQTADGIGWVDPSLYSNRGG